MVDSLSPFSHLKVVFTVGVTFVVVASFDVDAAFAV
jgi:hypothetical protein